MDGLTIAREFWERQEAIIRSQQARGMSDAALSRLPKPPKAPEPIELKPVLATSRDATRFDISERSKQIAHDRTTRGRFAEMIKATSPEFKVKWRDQSDMSARVGRAKAITGIVARLTGNTPEQLFLRPRGYKFKLAWQMAIYLSVQVTGIPLQRVDRLFNYINNHHSSMHAIKRVQFLRNSGDEVATDLYKRARAEILSRWGDPE